MWIHKRDLSIFLPLSTCLWITVCLSVGFVCDQRNVPYWLPSLGASQRAQIDTNQSVFFLVILTPLNFFCGFPKIQFKVSEKGMDECTCTH